MGKYISLLYGIIAYAIFLISFLYAIGFTGNFIVSKSIDSGVEVPISQAILVNVILLGLFAIQHTIMARPGFKKWLTKFIPREVERSTFVLIASLLLLLLYWQWRPMLGVVWNVENQVGRALILAVFWLGWFIVFLSTFMINHFDLFGLRQVYLKLTGKEYSTLVFTESFLYRYVRHPIMLGFIIAFWAEPHMTTGHLLFAIATTAYILIGIQLEERDLSMVHGVSYENYRRRVSMLVPFPGKKNVQFSTEED